MLRGMRISLDLSRSMLNETYSFVEYVLKNDLAIMNFIDSDFYAKSKPVEFYGINGVREINSDL